MIFDTKYGPFLLLDTSIGGLLNFVRNYNIHITVQYFTYEYQTFKHKEVLSIQLYEWGFYYHYFPPRKPSFNPTPISSREVFTLNTHENIYSGLSLGNEKDNTLFCRLTATDIQSFIRKWSVFQTELKPDGSEVLTLFF